ncbi:MAG TPA: hypothetical protein VHL58_09475 [Thermoanaerobaculia bacterium]|nr:hypothetical protein [Thermoanaerobaculia bacterium]
MLLHPRHRVPRAVVRRAGDIEQILEREVARPLRQEVFERISRRSPVDLRIPAADILRDERTRRPMKPLVVDASALIEYLLRTPRALPLIPLIESRHHQLHVPALADVEIASVLGRLLLRGTLDDA